MKSNVNQKKQPEPEGSDPSVSGIRKGSAAANMKTGEFGMVSRIENDCVVMPIRCTVDGTLCQEEIVMPESDCRPAGLEQKTILQRLFNGRRLCWDPRKTVVKVNDFLPADGERIRVSVLGEPVATGIFRRIDGQGRAVFYCLLMENGTLRCNTTEILGAADDYQFQPIGSTARNKLSKAMEAAHVAWNGHLHSFERENVSLERREFYYYLDEYFQIHRVQDTYKPRDRKRKAAGNYFATAEDVRGVQDCYLAILRLHHGDIRRKGGRKKEQDK